MPRWTLTLVERFHAKTKLNPELGCLVWTAAISNMGYGKFGVGSTWRPAHRVAWEIFNGPIPSGLHVLHSCGNGHLGCVTLAHLRLGTHAENMKDIVKARSHCLNGHAFDETNTRIVAGARQCRACDRDRAKAKRRLNTQSQGEAQ